MVAAGNITVNEMLSQFENWSQDKSGLSAADNGWFPGAIYGQFLAARASDILEEWRRDPTTVNKFVQQTIGCIEFEEVRVEECPCAPPSGCTWYRSTLPVPSIIGEVIALTAIGGNLQKLQHFQYTDWTDVKWRLMSRIPAERTLGRYCLRNDYVYIIQANKIRAAAMAAMFYDPVEVQRFPVCGKAPDRCNSFIEYGLFIDPGKYQKLIATTYQAMVGLGARGLFDATNNAQPAVAVEPVKP